jgi:hypothetical protein
VILNRRAENKAAGEVGSGFKEESGLVPTFPSTGAASEASPLEENGGMKCCVETSELAGAFVEVEASAEADVELPGETFS